jgi:tetratricopeptide (TPR) repeat protein
MSAQQPNNPATPNPGDAPPTNPTGPVVLPPTAAPTRVVIWTYYSRSSNAALAEQYGEVALAGNNVAELEKVVKSEKQNPTAKWVAKFQIANQYVTALGADKVGTPFEKEREEAFAKIETGRKYFEELLKENLKDEPALRQTAHARIALAEEVLCGAKDPQDASKYRGDVGKAIEHYREAAKIFPDQDLSKRYATKADNLERNRVSVERFYRTSITGIYDMIPPRKDRTPGPSLDDPQAQLQEMLEQLKKRKS